MNVKSAGVRVGNILSTPTKFAKLHRLAVRRRLSAIPKKNDGGEGACRRPLDKAAYVIPAFLLISGYAIPSTVSRQGCLADTADGRSRDHGTQEECTRL